VRVGVRVGVRCVNLRTPTHTTVGETMATTLDADGMLALIDVHSEAEQAREFPTALATMGPSPYYEFYPFRLRIGGPEAITELWSRIFRADGTTLHCFDVGNIEVDSVEFAQAVGDDMIVHIMGANFAGEDGERLRSSNVVRYRFEGDKMASETLWVCSNIARYLDTVFDGSFRALPGVEEI
jgi:hypothetical protein